MRVLVLLLPTAWSLGVVRMVAAPAPSPRPQRFDDPVQQVMGNRIRISCLQIADTIRVGLHRARTEVPEWPGVPIIGPCYWHSRGTGRSLSASTTGLARPDPTAQTIPARL
jgi:hypothetical protein